MRKAIETCFLIMGPFPLYTETKFPRVCSDCQNDCQETLEISVSQLLLHIPPFLFYAKTDLLQYRKEKATSFPRTLWENKKAEQSITQDVRRAVGTRFLIMDPFPLYTKTNFPRLCSDCQNNCQESLKKSVSLLLLPIPPFPFYAETSLFQHKTEEAASFHRTSCKKPESAISR